MSFVLQLYRWVFCRPIFRSFNLHLYKLSLRGLGILNSEGNEVSGETHFLKKLQAMGGIQTIFDVGANTGEYSQEAAGYFPQAKIYAFEPHPQTYQKLQQKLKKVSNLVTFNVGLNDVATSAKLWDFAQDAPLKHTQPTSPLSSLHKEVIERIHLQPAQSFDVKLSTIDEFVQTHPVATIDLLKVDTEGNEYKVFLGAQKSIKTQKIKFIQFEFNSMNAFSRSFLRDFLDLFPQHDFYRLLPTGFFSLQNYQPITHEIFGFQNIVGIPKNLSKKFFSA